MNIKSEDAHRLARELASLTGESVTAAVTEALRERLERVRRERGEETLADRLAAICRASAPHFREGFRSANHADLLYDQRGLPR